MCKYFSHNFFHM